MNYSNVSIFSYSLQWKMHSLHAFFLQFFVFHDISKPAYLPKSWISSKILDISQNNEYYVIWFFLDTTVVYMYIYYCEILKQGRVSKKRMTHLQFKTQFYEALTKNWSGMH